LKSLAPCQRELIRRVSQSATPFNLQSEIFNLVFYAGVNRRLEALVHDRSSSAALPVALMRPHSRPDRDA